MSRKLLILTALEMEAKALQPVAGSAAVRIIGIRAGRLAAQIARSADALILAGLAGALDPKLQIGDIIYQKFGDWPDLPYRAGLIQTVDHVIDSPQEKSELFRQTGAQAVDMESAIVQRFAQEAKLPLLILRAISDTAAHALPRGMMNWIDDIGRPKLAKLSFAALKQPTLMPTLKRLDRDSRKALAALANAVGAVIASAK
jgi:adenosylhomocysteine nucleosidase